MLKGLRFLWCVDLGDSIDRSGNWRCLSSKKLAAPRKDFPCLRRFQLTNILHSVCFCGILTHSRFFICAFFLAIIVSAANRLAIHVVIQNGYCKWKLKLLDALCFPSGSDAPNKRTALLTQLHPFLHSTAHDFLDIFRNSATVVACILSAFICGLFSCAFN